MPPVVTGSLCRCDFAYKVRVVFLLSWLPVLHEDTSRSDEVRAPGGGTFVEAKAVPGLYLSFDVGEKAVHAAITRVFDNDQVQNYFVETIPTTVDKVSELVHGVRTFCARVAAEHIAFTRITLAPEYICFGGFSQSKINVSWGTFRGGVLIELFNKGIIPDEVSISPASWRKAVYGKQPQKDKRVEWKKQAVAVASAMFDKDVPDHNKAEAMLIGIGVARKLFEKANPVEKVLKKRGRKKKPILQGENDDTEMQTNQVKE